MSIETSISHLKKVMTGDILTSKSYEIKRGKSIAIYEVKIVNQHNQLVSHFKGTVQITENSW